MDQTIVILGTNLGHTEYFASCVDIFASSFPHFAIRRNRFDIPSGIPCSDSEHGKHKQF